MTSRFPVYVICGQSNAEGFAPNAELPTTPVDLSAAEPLPNVFSFVNAAGGFWWPLSAASTTMPTGPGSNNKSSDPDPNFGPEMTFARDLSITDWPGERFGIAKLAIDGSALYPNLSTDLGLTNNWASTGGGTVRALWTNRMNNAKNAVAALGSIMDVRGIIWHQGEADSIFGENATVYDAAIEEYESRLTELFSYFRTFFVSNGLTTHRHEIPICLALINDDWYTDTANPFVPAAPPSGASYTLLQGIELIHKAQLNVVKNVPYVYSTATDGLGNNGTGDKIHLNGAGQAAHGSNFANRLSHFLKNDRTKTHFLQGNLNATVKTKSPMRPTTVMLNSGTSNYTLLADNSSAPYLPLNGFADVLPLAVESKAMDDADEVSIATGSFPGPVTLPAGQYDIRFAPFIRNPGSATAVRLFAAAAGGIRIFAQSPSIGIPASSTSRVELRFILSTDNEVDLALRPLENAASASGLVVDANTACGSIRKIGNAFES